MKDYLLDRMAEEEFPPRATLSGWWRWLAPVDGATLAMDEDGSLYLDELEAEDRLAFFIVYEVPAIRPPAVRFAELKVTPNKRVNAFSEILDDGGKPTRFGVRISESISPRPDDPTLRTVSGKLQNSGTILTQINRLTPGVTYYARPYAENSAGETIGPLKKIRIEEVFDPPFDAQVLGATEWFESPWFGTFHRGNDNWIFHAELAGGSTPPTKGFGRGSGTTPTVGAGPGTPSIPPSGATGPTTGCTSWSSATTAKSSGTTPPRWRKCPDRRDRSEPEPEFLTYSLRLDFSLAALLLARFR